MNYEEVKAKGTPYDSMIREAADRYGVNYDYLHKKLFIESSFNPNAVSPTGPRGLGQFTKATGRAYGLVSDADFFDPQKSINASAAYTRDLLGTYKGDYLKAALAYNQGNGRLGQPQLAALDRGDWASISAEGKGYMAKLYDVAGDSPSKKWFAEPNAPKSDAGFEALTKGVGVSPSVERGIVGNQSSLDLKQGPQQQTNPTFREMQIAQDGADPSTWDVVKASLATSVPGQILRHITIEDHDPMDWMQDVNTDKWTDADFQHLRDSGVNPQMFGFVFSQTGGDPALLPNAIAMAKENQQYGSTMARGTTGQNIVAGIAGAAVDPLTYVPVPGTAEASFAARVGKQAVFSSGLNVASEATREAATGIEGHYKEAAIGGLLVGGTMAAVMDRWIAKGARQAASTDEMSGAAMDKVLARHGESGTPVQDVPLVDGMQPTGHAPQEPDSIEKILAMHGESSDPNEFFGPTTRVQAREEAMAAGQDDPTRRPWTSDDHPDEFGGVDYVDHPGEQGAVRLRDGSILSGSNPLNPKTQKLAAQLGPERSAKGIELGNLTEIGYTLNRSEDADILDIGSQLFRSTVQTESGANGRFAATAADTKERLQGEDHLIYGRVSDAYDNILKNDPKYVAKSATRAEMREEVNRKVIEALEDSTGRKAARMSKQEKELHDIIKEHFERKEDLLKNPAQLGNADATPILDSTRHSGHYFPNIYDDFIKGKLIALLGKEGLQMAIAKSWLASYASRDAVRLRVDKMVKAAIEKEGKVATPEEIKQAVVKLAHDKAYGISHTDDFNRSVIVDDAVKTEGLTGMENNNFLEARNPFDSDVEIALPDGTAFSVNDLRVWDVPNVMAAYDRRINGDIGIMVGTGKDTLALKQRIAKIEQAKGKTPEVQALESAVRLLTGRARRDPDGAWQMAMRALNDLSFFQKNAYMAAQNFTEIAAMVTNGHLRMLMHGVPYLKEMTTWGTKIKPEQLRDMHDLIFGRELDDTIRPRRTDLVQKLRQQGRGEWTAQAVGTFKFGTQELAARSPFTKLLTETSNYIIDAARMGALMDAVRAAHGGEAKVFTPERLHMLSITPQQFEGIKKALQEHLRPDGEGFRIMDPALLRKDPRIMDLWRIGDKVADETILRPHKLSSQDTKPFGAFGHMVLQFKKFVLRSLNARVVRGYYDATKNGKGLDLAMQGIISMGLATGFYVAQRYVQAQAMPKGQRKQFLETSFSPQMLGYAALTRSSLLGAPFGVSNFFTAPLGFDPAAAVRTSVLPRGPAYTKKEHPIRYNPLRADGIQAPASKIAEQVPALGILGSVYQVGANAAGLHGNPRGVDAPGYLTGLYNGLRGLVPNDPLTQGALTKIMEGAGMEYQQRR